MCRERQDGFWLNISQGGKKKIETHYAIQKR